MWVSIHNPVRPAWSCTGCGEPWPCATRRQQLRAEFMDASVSLALAMSAQLITAVEDQPHAPAGSLYLQFLGWIRQG